MVLKPGAIQLKSRALNLVKTIEENKDLLKPPVNNKVLWEDSQFIVMLVGGPNKRCDFHVNPTDEFFYQVKGNCYVECINENGEREVVTVGEGDMFMLPANVPHSPHRTAGSYGIVTEIKRNEGVVESIVWYCNKCNHEMFRKTMELTNIETQLKETIEQFNNDEALRTCNKCGQQMPEEPEEWV
ncbi:3-hydroxyanthranilate 3,4-dioxygenase [Scopulibacillus darangshiensis]|uniref:3-hydroxyanthranilate 3,4-dioxygenase n=1 Tax=Scopulibacillus darangshiensis TaxID=442528 RepID=A0A4V2SMY4_9BACL|nr:3-hydroxyanthranilate 3,4-dioxygenase [Scopulibacillus darangshiensis]TCP28996.1 3-hydroxyanthranilate 3,4-dioxygenase [Scopulibacillus darangshiensis]